MAVRESPTLSAAGPNPPITGLLHRADFLRAAAARRQAVPGLLLQGRDRGEPGGPVRIGFTCSRKVGNAVARNRAKRRLRAAARAVLHEAARPGWDYVLIGRPGVTVDRDFAALLDDLRLAVARVHEVQNHRPPGHKPSGRHGARHKARGGKAQGQGGAGS